MRTLRSSDASRPITNNKTRVTGIARTDWLEIMEYQGDLYGKVAGKYPKLTMTTADVDEAVKDSRRLDWLLYTGQGLQFLANSGSKISRTEIDAEMETSLSNNEHTDASR